MSKSILKNLQLSMLAFGIAMGFIFPLYASFFVTWKAGMFIWFFLGCLLAGISVGLVGFWFVKIILIRKLKMISELANQIKEQDISSSINLQSNDEVGDIVNGLNAAVQNIRTLFTEILKVFTLSEEILSNVDSDTYDKEAAIDRINTCILAVTGNTERMEELSHSIERAVIKGKNITDCTGNQQLATVNRVLKFSEIMDSLVDRSKKINEILKIIEGIAGETNILALNASVEAARAGEYGKGFAVVAAEIRKLATNTSDSSQIISQNVKLIQDDVEKANKAVEEISAEVKQNNADITSISKQFSKINHTIKDNLQSNLELNNSVSKLNEAFNDIKDIFSELKSYLITLNSMMKGYKI